MLMQVEMKDKDTWETREETVMHEYKKKDEQLCRKSGCFSWIRKKKSKERESQRRNNSIFPIKFNVC
jgi:phosphoribosylaminoimidazole carboxylase (NCAIR synthetase)